MPYAAARVADIPETPWDNVHMKVRNGLASGSAFVETDIEAIHGMALAQKSLCSPNSPYEILDFGRR